MFNENSPEDIDTLSKSRRPGFDAEPALYSVRSAPSNENSSGEIAPVVDGVDDNDDLSAEVVPAETAAVELDCTPRINIERILSEPARAVGATRLNIFTTPAKKYMAFSPRFAMSVFTVSKLKPFADNATSIISRRLGFADEPVMYSVRRQLRSESSIGDSNP